MLTAPLLASIIGIAVLDSLNPSLFLAQFYLITTPRPTPRLLSYIAGILVVNFFGGLLILGGLRTLITDFFGGLSENHTLLLQLGIGLAILAFGLWYKAEAEATPGEVKKPRSLLPWHTFLLGMVVMVNELTTALPYFVAIERIAAAGLPLLLNLLALVIYNFIFSLPLLAFLGLFLLFRERFATQLTALTRFIERWIPRFIKYLSIVFGAGLMLGALVRVL